jgi:hypothetical protein
VLGNGRGGGDGACAPAFKPVRATTTAKAAAEATVSERVRAVKKPPSDEQRCAFAPGSGRTPARSRSAPAEHDRGEREAAQDPGRGRPLAGGVMIDGL